MSFINYYQNFCNDINITFNQQFAEIIQNDYKIILENNLLKIYNNNPKLYERIANDKNINISYQKFLILISVLLYIRKYQNDREALEKYKNMGFDELIKWSKNKIDWDYDILINGHFKNYNITNANNLFEVVYNKLCKNDDVYHNISDIIDKQIITSLLLNNNELLSIQNNKEDYTKKLLNESGSYQINITQEIDIEQAENKIIFKVNDVDIGTNREIPTNILNVKLDEIDNHNIIPKTNYGKIADIFNEFSSVELTRLNIPNIYFKDLDKASTYKIHFDGINVAQRTNITKGLVFSGKFEKYLNSYSFIPSQSCRINYHLKTAKIHHLNFYITKYNNKPLDNYYNVSIINNSENDYYNIAIKNNNIESNNNYKIMAYDKNLKYIDEMFLYSVLDNYIEYYILKNIPSLKENVVTNKIILQFNNLEIELKNTVDITIEDNYYTDPKCKYLNHWINKHINFQNNQWILGNYYYKTLKLINSHDKNSRPTNVNKIVYIDKYCRVIYEEELNQGNVLEIVMFSDTEIKYYTGEIDEVDVINYYCRKTNDSLFQKNHSYPQNNEFINYQYIDINNNIIRNINIKPIKWVVDYNYGLMLQNNIQVDDNCKLYCKINDVEYPIEFIKNESLSFVEMYEPMIYSEIHIVNDIDFCLTFK